MGIELRIVTSWRRITSSLLYGVKWVIGQVQTGGIDKYLVPYIAVVVTMCTGQGSFLCPISRHCYIIITWKALKHFYHPGLYQKSTFTMYVALVMCIFSNWEEKGKGGRGGPKRELNCSVQEMFFFASFLPYFRLEALDLDSIANLCNTLIPWLSPTCSPK